MYLCPCSSHVHSTAGGAQAFGQVIIEQCLLCSWGKLGTNFIGCNHSLLIVGYAEVTSVLVEMLVAQVPRSKDIGLYSLCHVDIDLGARGSCVWVEMVNGGSPTFG